MARHKLYNVELVESQTIADKHAAMWKAQHLADSWQQPCAVYKRIAIVKPRKRGMQKTHSRYAKNA